MKKLLLFVCLFVCISSASAQDYYPKLEGKYVSNYDGDTFKCKVLVVSEQRGVDFEERIITVRLLNVDTYEMRKKRGYFSQTQEETEKAIRAKQLVSELLQKGKIEIYPKYKDHYGRWVCKVYPYMSLGSLGSILKSEKLTTGKYEDKRIKRGRINRKN